MCGFAGWFDRVTDLRTRADVVQTMTRVLEHRGPDASGTWGSSRVGLGHCRLSIIDLAGGSQPMEIDGRVLVFSGEIYNFRELREDLAAAGQRFRTSSDTEVLLRAYLVWGESFVTRLAGMFAFAIWEPHGERLLLGRDRLGIKPLYYHLYPQGILFGSEPKAILANPLFRPRLAADGVAELFAVPGARTPGHGVFDGLAELLPGHVLTVDGDGATLRRYWTLTSHEHEDDPEMTVKRVRQLLEDIVSEQLTSDVPISALLSGGLDSSTVAALAARALERAGQPTLPTFSVDYADDEGEFQPDAWRPSRDGPFARLAAAGIGTRHHSVELHTSDVLDASDMSLRARDLPGWGDLDASMGLLFREVRRHCTVALSGESADEVFGGYPWYARAAAKDNQFFPWLSLSAAPSMLLRADVRDWVRPAEYGERRYAEAIAEVPALAGESPADRRMREAFYLGLTRWLPLLLDRKDRLSMWAGLEVRVPYCDHRLVEYLWNVPYALKARGGQEKGLLRSVAADLLPAEIRERRKCAPPACRNTVYAEAMRQRLHELVNDRDAPLFNLVDRNGLEKLLSAGEPVPGPTPGPNTNFALGYLLDIDRWLRNYAVQIA